MILTSQENYRRPVNWFDSPADFLDFCLKNDIGDSRYSAFGDSSWYGDETPSTCYSRRHIGRPDLIAEIEKSFAKFHRLQQLNLQIRSWEPSPMGAYPIVGDVLAGSPTPMRTSRQVEIDTSGIRILISTTSSAGISAQQLFQRGVVIAAFIRILAAIRPVEAYVLITGDGLGGATAIGVKLPTSPMDLSVVGWAASSVRFTRGYGYSFMRQSNSFRGGWPWNEYDHHQTADRMRNLLELNPQDVVIPPINLDDAIITNPYQWLEENLERYLPEVSY